MDTRLCWLARGLMPVSSARGSRPGQVSQRDHHRRRRRRRPSWLMILFIISNFVTFHRSGGKPVKKTKFPPFERTQIMANYGMLRRWWAWAKLLFCLVIKLLFRASIFSIPKLSERTEGSGYLEQEASIPIAIVWSLNIVNPIIFLFLILEQSTTSHWFGNRSHSHNIRALFARVIVEVWSNYHPGHNLESNVGIAWHRFLKSSKTIPFRVQRRVIGKRRKTPNLFSKTQTHSYTNF